MDKLEIKGNKYGMLSVLREEGRNKVGAVLWVCKCDCGQECIAIGSALNNGLKTHCGCLTKKIYSKRQKGKQHPKYNPNLTAEEREKRRTMLNGNNQNQWRIKVFERDGYECKSCRNTQLSKNNLHAHHMFSYKEYENLRFELNNGITLCKECHIEFHSIYGKKNNNPVQMVEFINTKNIKELV